MAVLYTNFIDGVLSADASSATTTVSASVFADLPEVTGGDEVWLVIDPDASAGAPEIVKVTAHALSSTDVTVERAQQGTTARAHLTSVRVTNAATSSDLGSFVVTAADLADGSVTTAKLADDAVTSAKLADDSVRNENIGIGQIHRSKLYDVKPFDPGDIKVTVDPIQPGFLELNGTLQVNAATAYPDLWAVAPASWKSGNDLQLPDMSDRVLRGGGTAGATDGSDTFALVEGNIPSHQHSTPPHVHDISHGHGDNFSTASNSHSHTFSGSTASDGHTHTQTSDAGTSWVFRPGGATGFGVAGGTTHYFQDSGTTRTSSSDSHSHSFSGSTSSNGHSHSVTGQVTDHSGSTPSGGGGTTGSAGSGSPVTHVPSALRVLYFIKT